MENTQIIISGLIEGKMTHINDGQLESIKKHAKLIFEETGLEVAICNFHVTCHSVKPKLKA